MILPMAPPQATSTICGPICRSLTEKSWSGITQTYRPDAKPSGLFLSGLLGAPPARLVPARAALNLVLSCEFCNQSIRRIDFSQRFQNPCRMDRDGSRFFIRIGVVQHQGL